MTTREEWRVTGKDADLSFPITCHFPTEAQARAWIAKPGGFDWIDGPHLHRRTVTVTEWEAI